MKPMKPRLLGGPHDCLAVTMAQIAAAEGQPAEAGVMIAAAFEGVSHFTLYKQLDPGNGKSEFSWVRLARLVSKFKVKAPAQYLAELAGYDLVNRRRPAISNSPLAALKVTVKETHEAIDAIAEIELSGGGASAAKRRAAVQQIDEGIEALIEARARIAPAHDGAEE